MTELVYKSRRRLTDEQREQRKEKERERQRIRREKERAWIKAKKETMLPKVPLTVEEKAQRAKKHLEEVEKKAKELRRKEYNPPTIIDIMQEIHKIYRKGELEELADKTGIFIGHFKSWLHTNMRPQGKYLSDLQEYFGRTDK
jgi:hypothetical protein